MPEGGAMDAFALRVANQLVGNDEGAATLEITVVGPTLRFEKDALVALAGAELTATIDHRPVPTWRAIAVRASATMTCGNVRVGCRAYLSVAGGVNVPLVLDSRSTYLRAAIGGLHGRALVRGDAIESGARSDIGNRLAALLQNDTMVSVASWGAGSSLRPKYGDAPTVRLLEGAHMSLLTAASREHLFRTEFRVGAQSDRMGYRLEGAALELSRPVELLSEAVAFGTVQLPPNGNPIVLMADRQTTGGYPRIGEVATVDLPLLAQLKPGDRFRFRPISLEQAHALYLARERDLMQSRQAISLLSLGLR
jgi:antagonist of KipI